VRIAWFYCLTDTKFLLRILPRLITKSVAPGPPSPSILQKKHYCLV
jgi:hypothetical protein